MRKVYLLPFILTFACKEAYVPPVRSTNASYLVVEGFINNGTDPTVISLTRSYKLDDTAQLQPELHAQVTVQGKDNSSYPLAETGNGQYQIAGLTLNNAIQYRLHISTSAGKEYVSDFVDLKASPPIDSVNWKNSDAGLQIYVNTHDPQQASHYYRWEYEQTWEFHSFYFSYVEYRKDSTVQPRPVNDFYTCWKSANSTNIFLYSSAKLSQDVVSLYPLVLIPPNSWEISLKYSILVKQYTLTPDAYQFWSDLKKNTEQLGTIFSPEPFQSRGNLHSVSDTGELVIGYISAGTMRQQRIFIVRSDIPGWEYSSYEPGCTTLSISSNKDSVASWLAAFGYLPVGPTPGAPPGTRWDISFASCVDCTLTGTNIQPAFWQ